MEKKNGLEETYHENGKIHIRVSYKNGKYDGVFEMYNRNGKLKSRSNYKNHKLNGISEWFDESGLIEYRESYKNGVKHGVNENFYRIETSRSCLSIIRLQEDLKRPSILWEKYTYVEGKLHGPYELYYRSGKLRERGYYKNGQIEEQEIFETDEKYDNLGGYLFSRKNKYDISENININYEDDLPF